MKTTMHHHYDTKGVCSVAIDFDIDEDGRLHNLVYTGGCNGNLKAIGKLVEGRPADEIADLLAGNRCRLKSTSCADQLARAIRQAEQK